MMRGFCPRGFCPEGAYVLMELCMEGVLSEGVLSGGGFVLPSIHMYPSLVNNNQHHSCMLRPIYLLFGWVKTCFRRVEIL